MEQPEAKKQESKEVIDKPKESATAEDLAREQAKMAEEKLQLAEDARVQAQVDAEKAAELLKSIKGEVSTAATESSSLSANAERVAAEKAAALAKSIEDGTYEWDGNVSQAENMKRMRAAETGVARRNESWSENARNVEAAKAESAASEAAASEAGNAEWSANAERVAASKAETAASEAAASEAGNAEWSANAERVAAEKAAALAKSIEDGTYEWDGNVSQAENMKRMRAAETGVARRNANFRKAA